MSTVTDKFEKMGARVSLSDAHPTTGLRIDIGSDSRGEFFDLRVPADRALVVLDLQPRDRHLVLLVRGEGKQRFLCGHDERHWFVAAVPERIPVTTVRQAKEALKPSEVQEAEGRLRKRVRGRRRNPASLRQGEWFFVPAPALEVDERHILRSEPLSRGQGSTPHVLEEAVRVGGETVYASYMRPDGLTPDDYERLLHRNPLARRWGWRAMKRNADVYARGRVSHPDHKTVVLRGWHRILMNTERDAQARQNVAFLD